MTRKGITAKRGKVVSNAEFRRMWETMPTRDIARELGISQDAVNDRARVRQLPPKADPRAHLRRTFGPELLMMWRDKVKLADIAAHYGLHPHVMERQIRKNGGAPRGLGTNRISISEWQQMQLSARMAESARIEQQALILSEMVDGARSRRAA